MDDLTKRFDDVRQAYGAGQCSVEGAGVLADVEARIRELEAQVEEALPEKLTPEQLDDACLSYRHDFGLMISSQKFSTRFECAEWWRAIRKALLARMGGEHDRS